MPSASWSLQQAVFAALSADRGLVDLQGGATRIYDRVPAQAAFPFIVLGPAQARDWSTDAGDGCEHRFQIDVWSSASGRREAAELAAVIRDGLHDKSLPLAGHRLVNLGHKVTEVRTEPGSGLVRATVRLRAVTEPL